MLTVQELNAKLLHGRALQRQEDPAVLFEIASLGLSYVEIGTRWGGSAIVAGLAGCDVYCIDPWAYSEKDLQHRTSPQHVLENWLHAGLDADKLHLFQQAHPPWPEALLDRSFATGMIDGAHVETNVRSDWGSMRIHVTGHVLFHDMAKACVRAVFREAESDPDWEPITIVRMSQFGIVRRRN